MATSTRSGAVYGIGVYGVAEYGVSNVTVVPDGVQAAGTTDSGLIITADSLHVVIGITASGAVGSIGANQITADAVVVPTGVEATITAGDITHRTVNLVPVTGVVGTGELGTVVISGDSNYTLDVSVEGTASVGTVVAKVNIAAPVTGVSTTGSIGTVTVLENEVQTPTGVTATGSIGSVTITTTTFDFNAVASQYSAARAVLVLRKTTSKDRTVRVPTAA